MLIITDGIVSVTVIRPCSGQSHVAAPVEATQLLMGKYLSMYL